MAKEIVVLDINLSFVINISVDIASLIEEVHLNKDQVDSMMDYTIKEITQQFANEWERVAAENLKASRQEYISNINVVDEGFAKGAVVLTGWLPNSVESGVSAFDMKDGLLNGPNAKVSKDGSRYNTVPYKHGTPGSLPENFSGGIMPKEIHKIVKKKKPMVPLKFGELPAPFDERRVKELPMDKGTYQHKNPIHEGIRKQKDSAGNISYESFRRVSDNSDENAWLHPGIEKFDLAGKAMDQFDLNGNLTAAFDNWWSQNM